jgi:hypothetical protein
MKYLESLKQNYILVSILVLATFLRFYHLDFQSLWLDEIYTLNISNPKLSLLEFHDVIVEKEGFGYLYFIIIRLLSSITEHSSLIARLPSAVAGVIGVYCVYLLGKQIFNKNAGLIAALLIAINDFHIYHSQEARPYTLFFLFAVLSFYRLSIFVKDSTYRNAIIYGLITTVALNVNFFALIMLFSQAVILLFCLILTEKEKRALFLKQSLLAGAIAILLFVPNYEILFKLLKFQSFWVEAPKEDTISILFKNLLGNSEITMFVFSLVFIYYFFTLAEEKIFKFDIDAFKNNKLIFSSVLLLGWLIPFSGVIIMKSYGGASLLVERYFISIIPVMVIILAIGIDSFKNNLLKGTLIITVLIFSIFNLVDVKRYYRAILKTQFRESSQFIAEKNKNNEPVVSSLAWFYNYYLNNDKVKTTMVDLPLDEYVNQMIQDSTKRKPFWYADAHFRPYKPSPLIQKYLDENFVVEDGIDLVDAWAKHYVRITNEITYVNLSKYNPLQEQNGDNINYNVENFEVTSDAITAIGWAFITDEDTHDSEINLVLIDGAKAIKIVCQKVKRDDVTTYFKSTLDLGDSGFSAKFLLNRLPPGKYQLGIQIKNIKTNKEGLVLSDKFFTK